MQVYNLHFKWTVSRGRDTYGYNICTLLVNGNKAGQCNGGGYDMQGASFAEWLESAFQKELLKFMYDNGINSMPPCNTYGSGNDITRRYELNGYYGMWLNSKAGKADKVVLDGGCGFSSIQRIAEAIGIKLQWNKESDRYKNHTFYTAIVN